MSTLKVNGRCVNQKKCPIIEANKIVGDFWSLWILRTLINSPKRFSIIEEEIYSINKATLNIKLKSLIKARIINKTFDKNLKPQYQISKLGKKLKPILKEIEKFGKENF